MRSSASKGRLFLYTEAENGGPVLVADFQQIGKPLCYDERYFAALSFEQGIGCNGRAESDYLYLIRG
jgi:hypothetical protein